MTTKDKYIKAIEKVAQYEAMGFDEKNPIGRTQKEQNEFIEMIKACRKIIKEWKL